MMQEPSRGQDHASTWYLPSFSNLLSCKTAVSLETPASSDIISSKADITSEGILVDEPETYIEAPSTNKFQTLWLCSRILCCT